MENELQIFPKKRTVIAIALVMWPHLASGVFVEQKHKPLAICSRWSHNKINKFKKMEMEKDKRKVGGRPKKSVKKEIRACIRFTRLEYFVIRQKANKAGVNASSYIREIAIKGQIHPRLNEEERHFVRDLVGMSNNINQLAKKAHHEGLLKAMLFFETYRNQLDALLKKVKDDK
jgi:hypothetical protein